MHVKGGRFDQANPPHVNYLCGVQPLVDKKQLDIKFLLLDAVVKAVEDLADRSGLTQTSLPNAWQAVCNGLDNMFYVGEGVFVQDAAASAEKSMTVSKLHLDTDPQTLEVNELPGTLFEFQNLRRVTHHAVELLKNVEATITVLEVDGRGRLLQPGLELVHALCAKAVNALKDNKNGLTAKCRTSHEFKTAVGRDKGTKLKALETAERASLLERLRLTNQVGAPASTWRPENYHELDGGVAYYF